MRYARTSFVWFIYTWVSINFFRYFTVKKIRLAVPAERLSRLYIQWFAYKYAICEEGLWKIVFVPKFLVYHWEIKGSETFLMLSLSEEKIDSPREHYNSFLLVTRKCCYRNWQSIFSSWLFLFTGTTKFSPFFFKLRARRKVKTHACLLLHFSALNVVMTK